MTPIQHDTILLEMMRTQSVAGHRIDGTMSTLRSYTDPLSYSERHPWRGPKVPDTRTPDEVYTAARAMVRDGDSYDAKYMVPGAVERYDKAVKEYGEAVSAMRAHEANYTGWSRFWLVTSSPGHVHSSLHCSSCKLRTTFALVPDLSGNNEHGAVAMFGPAMCTVCFPSAPTGAKISKALAESVGTPKFTTNLAKHMAKQGAKQ